MPIRPVYVVDFSTRLMRSLPRFLYNVNEACNLNAASVEFRLFNGMIFLYTMESFGYVRGRPDMDYDAIYTNKSAVSHAAEHKMMYVHSI